MSRSRAEIAEDAEDGLHITVPATPANGRRQETHEIQRNKLPTLFAQLVSLDLVSLHLAQSASRGNGSSQPLSCFGSARPLRSLRSLRETRLDRTDGAS